MTKMEYKQKKFPSWGCSIAKARYWEKQMANDTAVQLKMIDTSNNNIKLFRRLTNKIVLLVEKKHGLIPNEGSHLCRCQIGIPLRSQM